MRLCGSLLLAALAVWALQGPTGHPLGVFPSAGACTTEVTAWQARAQEGAKWVVRRYQEALQHGDQSVTEFWRQDARRAAGKIEEAQAARCVEVRP